MHEFQVLAVFFVIAAIYIGLFIAAEKFFMQEHQEAEPHWHP